MEPQAVNLTIEVVYSCPLCGLRNVTVAVPARETEDLIVWMEGLKRRLSEDHDRRSPGCRPQRLKNVKIPLTGTDRVGGAPKH